LKVALQIYGSSHHYSNHETYFWVFVRNLNLGWLQNHQLTMHLQNQVQHPNYLSHHSPYYPNLHYLTFAISLHYFKDVISNLSTL